MIKDLRHAFRLLGKSPLFTVAAVLTLALGIGANTAIFTVINGVLLRPLPYPNPAQLVTLRSNQSVPEIADLVEQSQSLEAIGGVGIQAADYAGGSEPIQVETGLVTGDFFRVLGARAALGRLLAPEDDRFNGARLLVISHALWQREFGGDPAIIGRNLNLSGQSYSVIGVTAPEFRPPAGEFEAYVPIRVFYPEAAKARGAHLMRAYGRLRAGVTMAAAQSELRLIDQRLAQANPEENRQRQTVLVSLREQLIGDIRPALLVLFGAVGLVLLIACANFANLLLARTAGRTQELTIRAALGAGRWPLVRQVLAESLVLAGAGGVAGLLLGSWGIDALIALKPEDLPRVENIHLDLPVLAFTFALALLTGVVFGILPAWQATRVDLNGVLTAGSRRVTATRSVLRDSLVVSELALALVLLVGAGLLGKAFSRLTSVAPGFDPHQVLTLRVELPVARYPEVPPQTQFRERVLEQMNQLPGVQAAMISELPLGGNAINHNFIIDGRPPMTAGEEPELYSRSIAGDYFRVLGIPLQRGRDFTTADRAGSLLVGAINESMVRRYFPSEDPIGARIRWARNEGVSWITIVGVVGNVRHFLI
ncbi:MAG: ABC transporter permease [Verrucomicrobiota bacterium]|nr:ABC transporter permease [Verrucomicrobiota bacterium]